jgi:hypothetical protein
VIEKHDFVRQGGVIWADGLVAWKDEQGTTKHMPPGPLSDVFGFTLEDIQAEWNPFSLAGGADRAGELWRCLIPKDTTGAMLKGLDGRPVAVRHPFGKGQTIYYATALTLANLRRESPEPISWIAAPAIAVSESWPVGLTEGPGHVAFRALRSGDRHGAVLTNWGAAAEVSVRFPASAKSATEIISGERVAVEQARFYLAEGLQRSSWREGTLS